MKEFEKNLKILNYISLICQIIIVLVDLKSGRNNFFTKNNRDYLLKEGKSILDDILNGSNFIEKKEFKRGYSPQSITMFNYGIESLENKTKIDDKVESYTDFFSILSDKMSDVCSGESSINDMNLLIDFFKSLNKILNIAYNKERNMESIKSKNEQIHLVYN